MSQFKQILTWTLSFMLSVLVCWNFSKAIGEMYATANQFLRLRRIRIAGNSGTTNFNNTPPAQAGR